MRKKLLRSRSGFEKPESREEAIMQNILGASNVLEPAESNIEEILQAILYNTPYTKEAESEIEKILLAIKNNGTYDGEGESRDMKILIAILNDLDYTEEAQSRIEELYAEWLQQRSQIKVLEGVPPLTFTSRGLPLINYLIEGNTAQNGTPSPNSPIMPEGCGDLETSGAKAGQYKIPITSAGQTTLVYLREVETTRKIKKFVINGTERWTKGVYPKNGTYHFYINKNTYFPDAKPIIESGDSFCTHFIKWDITGGIAWGTNLNVYMLISDLPKNATVDDFKAYLAAQYAAGTPVTIWYPLANEETGIVNEPLMKIGNYADTLSMEQAGVEIPTITGSNTLDVDTTVKPSNIYIEYK